MEGDAIRNPIGGSLGPRRRLTSRWNGPGMLRDFITKLYDVSG